jgi:putative membrane protein
VRRAALLAGLLALALAWVLPVIESPSFTRHMLTHMTVVAIAAPLIGIGLSGTSLDPSERVPVLFSPVIASLLDLVVVWFWHVPTMRGLAEAVPLAAVAEQASFLAAGLILWLACLGGSRQDAGSGGAGAFGLLVTSVHMTLLGALLALAPRSLYGTGEVTCFGLVLSAAEDQQIGGVIMLLVGAAVYLAGGVWLLSRVLTIKPSGGMAR